MKHPAQTGIARLIRAMKNSMDGLLEAWRREEAFRTEAVLLGLSVPVALWVGTSLGQVALLIGSLLLLMIVEIVNSAIEAIVDRIGPERHELSRIAKDLGSATVFLTALIPTSIWGALLLGRLGVIAI